MKGRYLAVPHLSLVLSPYVVDCGIYTRDSRKSRAAAADFSQLISRSAAIN